MNMSKTSSRLIGLPAIVSMLIGVLSSVIVNCVLLPLNSSEKSSSIWNLPKTHPENLSSLVSVTVNVAGVKLVPALKFPLQHLPKLKQDMINSLDGF